jgi:DNA polymerase-3 subunit alpha
MNINHALSVRSDFSIGESLLQLDHIIEKAKEFGYESVALVDTMSLHGMVDFSNKAKKAGIKPIIGCRLWVYDDPTYRKPSKASGEKEKPNPFYALKVYAIDETGVKSLLKLLSRALTPEYFYYHARCGLDDVLALEGVAVSTGDMFSLFHHNDHLAILEKLGSKFGWDKTFVELVPINTPLFDTLNAKAIQAATDANAKTLVTYPTLYKERDDADTLEVLNCITTNTQMSVAYRPKQFIKDFAFGKPEDLLERVKEAAKRVSVWNKVSSPAHWANGVKNIEVLAGMCNYEFKKLEVCLPKMADNEFVALGKKCIEGWKHRFTTPVLGYLPPASLMPVYKERLEFELGVLKKMGFSGYFLLVEDLVGWAKNNDVIVGPGRGSCFLPGHRVVCDKSGLTKAIENFSIGDKVLAHDGSTQEVIATLEFDRDEEIIELEFSNGVKIECTKDHKFFTRNRGWVVAEELCGEDEFDDVSELAKRLESTSSSSA